MTEGQRIAHDPRDGAKRDRKHGYVLHDGGISMGDRARHGGLGGIGVTADVSHDLGRTVTRRNRDQGRIKTCPLSESKRIAGGR